MCKIDLSLDIEHSSDSSISHCFDILFELWIGPNKHPCFRNLIEGESANEVGISFNNLSVDYENLLNIGPSRGPLVP